MWCENEHFRTEDVANATEHARLCLALNRMRRMPAHTTERHELCAQVCLGAWAAVGHRIALASCRIAVQFAHTQSVPVAHSSIESISRSKAARTTLPQSGGPSAHKSHTLRMRSDHSIYYAVIFPVKLGDPLRGRSGMPLPDGVSSTNE